MRAAAELLGWLTIALAIASALELGDFRYCFAPIGECFK